MRILSKAKPERKSGFAPAGLCLFMLGSAMTQADHLRRIRICLGVFIAGLVASGVTAFPLETELKWVLRFSAMQGLPAPALGWLQRVSAALSATNARYPFLAYGTDWLAFGHLVIAAAFIGPWIDPVRNKWFVTFGLVACAGVIPLALIAGPIAHTSASARRVSLDKEHKCMNTVLEIERAITALSPKELAELYAWMDQNSPVDVQLKADLEAGRFDDRIARALVDRSAGNTRSL
jgi:hypothetical protein